MKEASNIFVKEKGILNTTSVHKKTSLKTQEHRISLVVWWLRLHTFTTVGMGSIPGHGTKILPATINQNNTRKKR